MIVDLICSEMFTKKNVEKALIEVGNTLNCLPKKYTLEQKEAMIANLKSQHEDVDRVFKAFIKNETSKKPKPRNVVNHGERRVAAVAKIAAVYEHILFSRLKYVSIKGRAKRQALTEIAKQMSRIPGMAIESDLTAFEFGIRNPFKACEAKILRHIAGHIGCLGA